MLAYTPGCQSEKLCNKCSELTETRLSDDLEERSDELFGYLLANILANSNNIVYIQFNYNFIKNIADKSKLCRHCDLTKFARNDALREYSQIIETLPDMSFVIIDSLAHMIYKLGSRDTYKLVGEMCKNSAIKQILTQLHSDLVYGEEDTLLHVASLASVHIKMERQLNNKRRLSYTCKKGRGKMIRKTEEFSLEDGRLVMIPLSELKVTSLLQTTSAINVDSLTSFKIELSEQDKINRSQMDLPFLPRNLQQSGDAPNDLPKSGQIDYVFDEGDDWDAEDPDDDLNI